MNLTYANGVRWVERKQGRARQKSYYMRDIRAQRDADLRMILTREQYETYKARVEELTDQLDRTRRLLVGSPADAAERALASVGGTDAAVEARSGRRSATPATRRRTAASRSRPSPSCSPRLSGSRCRR